MSYTQKQKSAKRLTKIAIIAGAVILVVILMIVGISRLVYARKYSVNNVSITVVDKADIDDYYYDYSTELTLQLKNRSSQGIREVLGEMTIFNSDKEELMDADVTLTMTLEPGETTEITLEIDEDVTEDIEELCGLDLENLKITFKINSIVYENHKQKEYKNSPTKTINMISEDKSYWDEKYENIRTQFDKAMQEYEKVDVNSVTFEDDIYYAVSLLDDIWDEVSESEEMMGEMYDIAMEYKNKAEYEKAYFLFALMSSYDYSDSQIHADECYDLAGKYQYNSY